LSDIVIIKIGTQILTTEDGMLDLNNLRSLVNQIAKEMDHNHRQFILVTSGAITCGAEHMEVHVKTIPEKQAAASAGQILLLQQYFHFFLEHRRQIGQILLTRDGLEDKTRRDHAKNTIDTLLKYNVIPIINENDTVAIDEIRFGDNDELSALVAQLVQAKLLILLTSTDGVYKKRPGKGTAGKHLRHIDLVTDEILDLADDTENQKSRGGMRSKLMAAKHASECNIDVVIANGRQENVIHDILAGKSVGTHIRATKKEEKSV